MHKYQQMFVVGALIFVDWGLFCEARTPSAKTQAPRMTVSELLKKYAQTQDMLRSFIVEIEHSSVSSSSFDWVKNKKKYSFSDIRFDGNRFSIRTRKWGNVFTGPHIIPKEDPLYQSFLWDGTTYYQYSRGTNSIPGKSPRCPFGRLKVFTVDHTDTKAVVGRGPLDPAPDVTPLSGAIGAKVRVDFAIRQAETASVRDKLESVGRSKCYVIDAKTKIGDYTLWIDPEHTYNIAKSIVRQSGDRGHLRSGNPMVRGHNVSLALRNVRFESIDGLWVPMEADFAMNTTLPQGKYSRAAFHCKRTKVVLNPDHDKLGSFVPDDVKNGAVTTISGIDGKYKWQDGRAVDQDGGVVFDFKSKEKIEK